MLILKGNIQKSVVVSHILENASALCYVYYDDELPFDNVFINSEMYSLTDLKNTLNDIIDNLPKGVLYDYFIVYTNNTEDELKKFIVWLDDKSKSIIAKNVILTCRRS